MLFDVLIQTFVQQILTDLRYRAVLEWGAVVACGVIFLFFLLETDSTVPQYLLQLLLFAFPLKTELCFSSIDPIFLKTMKTDLIWGACVCVPGHLPPSLCLPKEPCWASVSYMTNSAETPGGMSFVFFKHMPGLRCQRWVEPEAAGSMPSLLPVQAQPLAAGIPTLPPHVHCHSSRKFRLRSPFATFFSADFHLNTQEAVFQMSCRRTTSRCPTATLGKMVIALVMVSVTFDAAHVTV